MEGNSLNSKMSKLFQLAFWQVKIETLFLQQVLMSPKRRVHKPIKHPGNTQILSDR